MQPLCSPRRPQAGQETWPFGQHQTTTPLRSDSAMTTAYERAIAELPATPGKCSRCQLPRVGTMLGASIAQMNSRPWVPTRYGCPECEVALLESADHDAMMWSAVLRNEADPHWSWVPAWMRAAFARIGF